MFTLNNKLKNICFLLRKHIATTTQNKKNLMLFDLAWKRAHDPAKSLGHTSLLANLNKHKINVLSSSWAINSFDFSIGNVLEFIFSNMANKPFDIAIGTYVWNEKIVRKLIQAIRQHNFSGRIILGGPQISYTQNNLEKIYREADVFIRGYAENALAELIEGDKNPTEIKGVHIANRPDKGSTANLDIKSIRSPILNELIPPSFLMRWETKRGCPFKCAFCQYDQNNQSPIKKEFSLDRALQEANFFLKNPDIKRLSVVDPTFNYGNNYISILEFLIANNFDKQIELECRIELVTTHFLDLVEKLNKTASVILQFGLQTTNRQEQKLINRLNNLEKAKEILIETNQRNIKTELSLIYGLPLQTLDSFRESVEFCQNNGATIIRAFPLLLLRGTKLYNQRKKLALTVSSETDSDLDNQPLNHFPYVIKTPHLAFNDWLKMGKIARQLELNNESLMHDTVLKPGLFHYPAPKKQFDILSETPPTAKISPA